MTSSTSAGPDGSARRGPGQARRTPSVTGPAARRDQRRPSGPARSRPAAPGTPAAPNPYPRPGAAPEVRRRAAADRTRTGTVDGAEALVERAGAPARSGARPGTPAVRQAAERQPHRWFAQRLLDVLSGRRPATWMLGHTSGPTAYDRVWELAADGVLRPPAGRPAPVVRRCGCASPVPGVLEAYALIASGPALRALAFRLERGDDRRWRCAAVDFTGPAW